MANQNLRDSIAQNIAAHAGSLLLPDPSIAISSLDWLLRELLSETQLSLTGASLSNTSLSVTGQLSLFGVAFDVTLSFGDQPVTLSLSASLSSGQTPSLAAVVQHFFPSVSAPDVDLSELTLSASTGDTSFSVNVGLANGTHGIALGARGLVISAVSGALTYDKAQAAVSADLQLTALIGSSSVVLDYKPPRDLSLTGTVPRIDLSAAINAFLQDAFAIPAGFPSISLRQSTLSISQQSGSYSAALTTTVNDWGVLELHVQRAAGIWQVASGFVLPDSFALAQISSVFNSLPLDGATLSASTLLLSSYTGDNPFQNPALQAVDVVEGVSFGATLDTSGSSGALSQALGFASGSIKSLALQGVIASPLTNSYVQAALQASTTIPNTRIGIGNPSLRLSLAPAIQVRGDVMIPLKGQFIDLSGGLTVSLTEASLFVDADFSKLANLVGFAGVTLENIGGSLDVTFEPPGVGLTLQGDFLIGSSKADSQFALSFSYTPPVEVNPRLLRAQFAELDLSTMITALAPNAQVPAQLDSIAFRNFTIYWADSQVALPDGTTANPGYGFNALVDFFGWTAYGALAVDSSKGFKGQAALSPIDIGHGAFRFTGNGKGCLGVDDGGPTLDIDTTQASFSFSAAALLLGITGAASGSFSSGGAQFSVSANTGGGYNYIAGSVTGRFSSNIASPDISFGAAIAMGLDFTTARITFPGTSYAIGRLHVQAAATGSMNVSLQGTRFQLGAGVGFGFMGQSFNYSLPTISAQPSDLANFGDTIANSIANNAASVFGGLWSSAAGYINLIAKGVLTDLDGDPLGVLINVFHMSEGDALKLLASLKGLIPHVDTQFPPHGDTKGPHVDTPHADVKPHADSSGPHLDTHADVRWVVDKHVDSAPHADGSGPHVDTHADTAPHIDTPSTHVDI